MNKNKILFSDTILFIKDRFPLYVGIPLATILFVAPNEGIIVPLKLITGTFSFFIILLSIRFFDDYFDLETDRVKSPNRALVTGIINSNNVIFQLILLFIVVLIIQYSNRFSIIFILLLLFWYGFYFLIKKRILVVFQPLLINAMFFIFPAFTAIIQNKPITISTIIWGSFFFFAVVGHDYGHSINENLANKKLQDLNTYLPPQKLVLLSTLFYILSFISGCIIFTLVNSNLFLGILIIMGILVSYILSQIWKEPCEKNAKKLYVPGFLFFIIPSIVNIIIQYLR